MRPRPIPKRVFQVIALILLVPVVWLTVHWYADDSGLVEWIDDALGPGDDAFAAVLGFCVLLVAWAVVVVPIRRLSAMPTLREELDAAGHASLRDAIMDVVRRGEALGRVSPRSLSREQRRARGRALVLGGVAVVGVLGSVSAAYYLLEGSLVVFPAAIAALVCGAAYVVRTLRRGFGK